MIMDSDERYEDAVLAGQDRFCPEAALLMEKEQSVHVVRHLQQCEFCRERMKELEGEQAWDKLAELVNESLPVRDVPHEVRPGQIWQLAHTHGGWGDDGYYYHSPQVLVLAVHPCGVARVAHIGTFMSLAADGDVVLETSPWDSFAEMWNVYSVPEDWLDRYLGEVSGTTMSCAFLKEQGWKSPEEGSAVDVFRQQELYHSVHFALGAMEEVMERAEAWQKKQRVRYESLVAAFVKDRNTPDWNELLPNYESMSSRLAAASMTRVVDMPEEENACTVRYEEGILYYSFNYIPDGTLYVVVLRMDGDIVEVRDEDGNWHNHVVVESDGEEERFCRLSEEEFEACDIQVYAFPSE